MVELIGQGSDSPHTQPTKATSFSQADLALPHAVLNLMQPYDASAQEEATARQPYSPVTKLHLPETGEIVTIPNLTDITAAFIDASITDPAFREFALYILPNISPRDLVDFKEEDVTQGRTALRRELQVTLFDHIGVQTVASLGESRFNVAASTGKLPSETLLGQKYTSTVHAEALPSSKIDPATADTLRERGSVPIGEALSLLEMAAVKRWFPGLIETVEGRFKYVSTAAIAALRENGEMDVILAKRSKNHISVDENYVPLAEAALTRADYFRLLRAIYDGKITDFRREGGRNKIFVNPQAAEEYLALPQGRRGKAK